MRDYQVCVRCVMDTSDPDITFDEHGVCNHCRDYDLLVRQLVSSDDEREARLEAVLGRIQRSGRRREYDCVIGVSGGVDSSYVAYLLTREFGLRPLAVHMDNGWNSNLAVSNIERLVTALGIDLYTEVLNWPEFRDLQLAFLKASTPDSEIPTDHAITAVLMQQARSRGIRYIVGGSNIRTEAILPAAWSQGIRDWRYIESVHREFGTRPLASFPHFTPFDFAWSRVRGQRWINILNYVDYRKSTALEILQKEVGYEPYATKHGESVYTRFFQNYILPVKFGYDKRRAHLSALICAGEITRDEALAQLAVPPASDDEIRRDKEFVAKKLGLSVAEFDAIMALPPKTMYDYRTYETAWWHALMRAVYRAPRQARAAVKGRR